VSSLFQRVRAASGLPQAESERAAASRNKSATSMFLSALLAGALAPSYHPRHIRECRIFVGYAGDFDGKYLRAFESAQLFLLRTARVKLFWQSNA
jgi:hypothetical protein